MTADATIAAANANREIVLSRSLLHGSVLGFSVGSAVGVGKTWLLLAVVSMWKYLDHSTIILNRATTYSLQFSMQECLRCWLASAVW